MPLASSSLQRVGSTCAAMAGDNDHAKARQAPAHEGAQAVSRVLPLLRHENTAVREAAFQVLADLANEASAALPRQPRAAVTTTLMTFLEDDAVSRDRRCEHSDC